MTNRYFGIIPNDVVNGNGVCTSLFLQGCPIHCPGCHDSAAWDFSGGHPLPPDFLDKLSQYISANGILRNFSLLGGEPFCDENLDLSLKILSHVRNQFPTIKIHAWSGYTFEQLQSRNDERIQKIFSIIDILVDSPFILSLRDVTLKMRGSSNQRIIDVKESLKHGVPVLALYLCEDGYDFSDSRRPTL